ncbi:hypothetical protein [Halobaculum litoreum]|uniref:DUF8060 domain-containing protein n=1 Tax=Halobaculum litoreum TaxID=3031998 RepID=A0ABD5XNC7_9EURY|nr:hypothetical protein [Halobaculum sp. DT92]
MSEEHAHDGGTEGVSTTGEEEAGGLVSGDVSRYVNYVLLAALLLLALVAGVQFYTAVSRTITRWVTDDYRSLVTAAFNLAVLLVAAAGVSRQIRRLTN